MNKLTKALHNECQSFQIYDEFSRLYHFSFESILQIKQSHVSILQEFLRDESVKKMTDEMVLSGDFADDLAFLIGHENENIAFYNVVIDSQNDAKIKDMFYRFQAHSFNEILPALQGLNSFNSNQLFNEFEKTKEFFNEATQTLNKLQNKKLSQAELESFLKKLNFSLLGGALLGAAALFMFNEITNQHKKD